MLITPKSILKMEEILPKTIEWSIPVPSVQDLSIQGLQSVPSRYIRDDMDDINTIHSDPSLCVPLIDMNKLVNPDSQDEQLQKLHYACKHWGVFQLINHEISEECVNNMKKEGKKLFDLPLKEKKKLGNKGGSLEGYGQAFVTSEDQKLIWNDMLFLKTLPIHTRNPNFWPNLPSQFREALEKYSEEIKELAVKLTRYIEMGIGIEMKKFSKGFEDGIYELRMNYYPPCPEPEKVIGAGAHVDICGITFLLECGNIPGLQSFKDGNWVFVQPIDGAIVVDVGQILEMYSNGIYKASKHRAVVVSKLEERMSIVTFCYPNSSLEIGPAKELINAVNLPLYQTLTHEEYFGRFLDSKLHASFIDSLKMYE